MNSSKKSRKEDNRVASGRSYEKLAAQFFIQNGYEILERNWQAGQKEIDLIVRKGNEIAFVEVKSVASTKFGHPAQRVDKRKISNLTEAARRYQIEKEIDGCDLRFDVVTFIDGQLEYFPNAFEASD